VRGGVALSQCGCRPQRPDTRGNGPGHGILHFSASLSKGGEFSLDELAASGENGPDPLHLVVVKRQKNLHKYVQTIYKQQRQYFRMSLTQLDLTPFRAVSFATCCEGRSRGVAGGENIWRLREEG
jgi:hypothetical protein